MKSAKIFLTGMYLHLLLSILTPAGILFLGRGRWNASAVGLFMFYLAMICIVGILGWISVAMAFTAYRLEKYDMLKKGWLLLKFASIPFYLLNFVYSFLVWFLLVGASRGLMALLVPVPVLITCTMIIQSGCFGVLYIRHLRKQPEYEGRPSGIHYVLQMIAVLDVISTLILWRKYH